MLTASLRSRPAVASRPAWDPWGVQLTANWSEGQVLASYERLRRTFVRFCAIGCRWSCAPPFAEDVGLRDTSSAFRKRRAWRPMRYARGCVRPVVPAWCCATRLLDTAFGRRNFEHCR